MLRAKLLVALALAALACAVASLLTPVYISRQQYSTNGYAVVSHASYLPWQVCVYSSVRRSSDPSLQQDRCTDRFGCAEPYMRGVRACMITAALLSLIICALAFREARLSIQRRAARRRIAERAPTTVKKALATSASTAGDGVGQLSEGGSASTDVAVMESMEGLPSFEDSSIIGLPSALDDTDAAQKISAAEAGAKDDRRRARALRMLFKTVFTALGLAVGALSSVAWLLEVALWYDTCAGAAIGDQKGAHWGPALYLHFVTTGLGAALAVLGAALPPCSCWCWRRRKVGRMPSSALEARGSATLTTSVALAETTAIAPQPDGTTSIEATSADALVPVTAVAPASTVISNNRMPFAGGATPSHPARGRLHDEAGDEEGFSAADSDDAHQTTAPTAEQRPHLDNTTSMDQSNAELLPMHAPGTDHQGRPSSGIAAAQPQP